MGEHLSATGGLFYYDGELIGEIKEADIISVEESANESSRFFTPESFEGSFTIAWSPKFKRKTMLWFRKYQMIDLLPTKFPKKKNRRKKRLERKICPKQFKLNTILI